jgi:hypothetical protein
MFTLEGRTTIQASIYFVLQAIEQPEATNDLFVDVDIESKSN